MPTVKLSEIIDAIDSGAEESTHYYDRKTGKILYIDEESNSALSRFEEDEDKGREYVATFLWAGAEEWIAELREAFSRNEDLIELPTGEDIEEHRLMADFAADYHDGRIGARLSRAIEGKGAFRRFKDAIHEHGIADEWDEYRAEALKRIAIEWCEMNDLPYEDDTPPPAPNRKAEAAAEQVRVAYDQLVGKLRSLLKGERDAVANMANMAALVYHSLPDVNWVGFYRLVGEDLVLGPFQGKPACVRIKPKQGVCGTAVATKQTLVVRNVHEFPGHIACDPESNAELVVPIVKAGKVLGVFDLDSPTLGRFSDGDAEGVARLVAVLVEKTDFVVC